MGIVRGTNIVQDDLVFGFDTGYGVADPGVSTRFFKGKPTTNLQVNGVAAGHNSGNYGNVVTVADAPEKGPRWKKVTISNRGSNFRILQWTYTTHESGVVYSHSAEFDWGNMRGKGYYMPFDGNGGGTRVHYINRNYTTNGGSNINANRQDGHFASTIVKSGGNHIHAWFIYNNSTGVSGLNDYFYYRDYQVEKETEASPFISGTRSNTGGLIDLKRTTDISLANVSFSSNGQPTFDGTNDEIQLPSSDWNKVTEVTVEAVVKINGAPIDGNAYHVVVQKDGAYSGGAVYGIRISNSSQPYGTFSTGNTSSTTHVDTVSGSTMTSNKYYHLVYTRKVSESIFYQNGTPIDTNTGNNGVIYNNTSTVTIGQGDGRQLYGDIPVVKIYNKVLTASEIKQNYNAYKNRFNL